MSLSNSVLVIGMSLLKISKINDNNLDKAIWRDIVNHDYIVNITVFTNIMFRFWNQ